MWSVIAKSKRYKCFDEQNIDDKPGWKNKEWIRLSVRQITNPANKWQWEIKASYQLIFKKLLEKIQ